ncbi:MAG: alanine dehydrogenase [Bacteroidales bacterium]|nr:alanine dehydrogenase [Bacteroidales bacterium]
MMEKKKQLFSYKSSEQMMPQEQLMNIEKKSNRFSLGIPKEEYFQERRIPLAPESVAMLVEQGHHIKIQEGAGRAAHFNDIEYIEAGATIAKEAEEIYKSDIILKVAPPTIEEIDMIDPRKVLISALHTTMQKRSFFTGLMQKKITAFCFEEIKDETGNRPIIQSINEIVGNSTILIAASYLASPTHGKGNLLGGFTGITPTEIVIIGSDTVAAFAAKTAIGMGATVKIFDNNITRLRQLILSLPGPVFSSIIQPKVLSKALTTADVVIGAFNMPPSGNMPYVVTEEMVKKMKSGAVLIDVSIDYGGCIETSSCTSHKDPVYVKHGVTHYAVPNIASRYARTASYALSNYFTPLLLRMGDYSSLDKFILDDKGFLSGIYVFKGILVNYAIGKQFNIPSQDIDLLMAAF